MFYDVAIKSWFHDQSLSVGESVLDFLRNESDAVIIGVTSKGIFLKTHGNHIIFLSSEKFTGPLTIKLNKISNQMYRFCVGQNVQLSKNFIIIPKAKTKISVDHSLARTNALPLISCVSSDNCFENLLLLIRTALTTNKLSHFSSYLPYFLNSSTLKSSIENTDNLYLEISCLIETIRTGSTLTIINQLSKFLGNGIGLTPSGDDLVLGITLLINRWTHILDLAIDVNLFNKKIIELAFRKTTLLSANLITCASKGRSDERIEAMADAIFLNNKSSLDTILSWMTWGATSSLDALLGMGILLIGLRFDGSELMI